ncbi:MAG: GNAT family N-acetyltransferase [Gammaproteobacteria bacterium]
MIVCETARLRIRRLEAAADAAFIRALLNEPSFIQNIADRGVRTLEDASRYITAGPLASYAKFGFGLFMAEREDGTPIGMCGLLQRDWLEDPDIGFAYLPQFWSKGYAFEAAAAVMAWGRETKGLTRIVGITAPHNVGSIRVLEKLGLRFARLVRSPEGVESRLFTPDGQ